MPDQMEGYVKEKLQEGYSEEKIRRELLSEGYDQERVDQALRSAGGDNQEGLGASDPDPDNLPSKLKILPGAGIVLSVIIGFVPIGLLPLFYGAQNTPPPPVSWAVALFLPLSIVVGWGLSWGLPALAATYYGAMNQERNITFSDSLKAAYSRKWRYLKWAPISLAMAIVGDVNSFADIHLDRNKFYAYPVILFEDVASTDVYSRSSELVSQIPDSSTNWLKSEVSGFGGFVLGLLLIGMTGGGIIYFGEGLISTVLSVIFVAEIFMVPLFGLSWMFSRQLDFCYIRGYSYDRYVSQSS